MNFFKNHRLFIIIIVVSLQSCSVKKYGVNDDEVLCNALNSYIYNRYNEETNEIYNNPFDKNDTIPLRIDTLRYNLIFFKPYHLSLRPNFPEKNTKYIKIDYKNCFNFDEHIDPTKFNRYLIISDFQQYRDEYYLNIAYYVTVSSTYVKLYIEGLKFNIKKDEIKLIQENSLFSTQYKFKDLIDTILAESPELR